MNSRLILTIFAVVITVFLIYGTTQYYQKQTFALRQSCFTDSIKYIHAKQVELDNFNNSGEVNLQSIGNPKASYGLNSYSYSQKLNTCFIDYDVDSVSDSYKSGDEVIPPSNTSVEVIDNMFTGKNVASWIKFDLYHSISIKGHIGSKNINNENEFASYKSSLGL